jgi:alpha-D-ribose 1-methylphosphonate 5-triphosphate diphosphatase
MWLSNVNLVTPVTVLERGYLRIEEGLIVEVGQGKSPSDIDGQGCYVLPGLIDLHGDMIERDVEPRPRAFFPTDVALLELDKRLAALGITTAYASLSFADTRSREGLPSELRAKGTIELIHRLQPRLLIDMKIHARLEVSNHRPLDVIRELLVSDQIHLLSLMDHTPGQGQYRDIEHHISYISAWQGIDADTYRAQLLARLEKSQAHPTDWETINALCQTAKHKNIKLASHDDDTIQKVDFVSSLGVTISEFPVTLEAAREAKNREMMTVMGAPNAYRGSSNSGNLSALEALKENAVDILASDYYPAAMLHSVFKLEGENVLPLHEAVKLVSTNPAKAMGLDGLGSIELGKQADLVLIDKTSPVHVRGTLRAGRVIFWDGVLSHFPQQRIRQLEAAD